jgi:hypothetical protein
MLSRIHIHRRYSAHNSVLRLRRIIMFALLSTKEKKPISNLSSSFVTIVITITCDQYSIQLEVRRVLTSSRLTRYNESGINRDVDHTRCFPRRSSTLKPLVGFPSVFSKLDPKGGTVPHKHATARNRKTQSRRRPSPM